jgi:hypothetical protein
VWRQLSARLWQVIASPAGVIAHLGVYLVASTALVLANAIGSPGALWFWRPVMIWGAILAGHALLPLVDRSLDRIRAATALIVPLWTRIGIVSAGWSLPMPSLAGGKHVLGMMREATKPEQATSWPAPGASSTPAPPAGTWPEAGPTWATSWPAPPSAPVFQPPVRPTGSDTVLNGAQMANPEHPRWDELEVAAASWLAQRTAEPEQKLTS